ncbi:B3 domain-containing protein [Cardamine amara subsp. amara]|uniref:B3 domain-containing protein n=1 Tax=Cardamine amara subsp. amara TaxID=228776 RepID=A0ABD1BDV1_CARAN
MSMNQDDHLTDSAEEKWSRFCMLVDVAIMVYEEDQRRLLSEKGEESKFHKTDHSVEESHKRIFYLFPRKTRSSLVKRRYTQENPNGALTSSSLLLDLNKMPIDCETQNLSSESEPVVYDEEQRAKKGKSKIVSEEEESEKTQKRFVRRRYLQQNYVKNLNGASTSSSHLNLRYFESSLVPFDYNKAEYEKTETNHNYQTSPSSCLTENTNRKRRAVKQRKNKGGFKKAKIASFPRVARETPEWVFQVIRGMNGDVEEEPRLFFERDLTASDVNLGQSRLLIPFNQLIRNDFLTSAESLAMGKDEEDLDDDNIGVGTILVNQRSEKWGLRFKIWSMEKKDSGKGTLNYALNWGWNDVVKGNNLKLKSKINLWTFRCRGVLCFALGIV